MLVAAQSLEVKGLLKDPRHVEASLVDALVVHALQHSGVLTVGCQHPHYRSGRRSFIPLALCLRQALPPVTQHYHLSACRHGA